ncbi:Uncharacterised protein [uncultured archaeon]|nr:Uncharacterised protein [uncultured archaeon]
MEITNLGDFDLETFNDLVDKFEKSHIQTKKLAARLRQWKPGGKFEPKDKSDLMEYCIIAGDEGRRPARIIARQIRNLVFGKTI